MRELAFLTPQAKFIIQSEITEEEEEFHYEGGLNEFILFLNPMNMRHVQKFQIPKLKLDLIISQV